jgi:hypothetical protein
MKNQSQYYQLKQLAQIPPEIWKSLPLEAKKWLLNERKRQQQEGDKMKKSLVIIQSTAVSNDKETSSTNMTNQFAIVIENNPRA